VATPHEPVTFCLWPPDGQLEPCGRPALPGLLMVSPSAAHELPFCGEHADDAWAEGWTRVEQLCEFDDAGRVGELCGQPATGVVVSHPGITIWRRRACPAHLTTAEHDNVGKIRPLGPWSDATPEVPAHLAHLPLPWTHVHPGEPSVTSLGTWTDKPSLAREIEALHVRAGAVKTDDVVEEEARLWDKHNYPETAKALRASIPDHPVRHCPDDGRCHHHCLPEFCYRVACCGPLSAAHYPNDTWPTEIVAAYSEDYVTETEGAAMVARHSPVSAAPRPLPRHYTSRPGWFGCGLLAAAVGLTGAFWAWCWLRDVVRGLVGPG